MMRVGLYIISKSNLLLTSLILCASHIHARGFKM